jgi:hypothetical protein
VITTASSADVRAESVSFADPAVLLYAAAVEMSDAAVVTTAASADVRAATSTAKSASERRGNLKTKESGDRHRRVRATVDRLRAGQAVGEDPGARADTEILHPCWSTAMAPPSAALRLRLVSVSRLN